MRIVNTVCPVCKQPSVDIAAKPRKTEYQADLQDYEKLKYSFVGLNSGRFFFTYYKCQTCETQFCKEYFSEEEILKLYSDMPDNTMNNIERGIIKTNEQYVSSLIKDCIIETSLEIGPDLGYFASVLQARHKPNILRFVELNKRVHQLLLSKLKDSRDVKIVDNIKNCDIKSFDLITMIHVLDHLTNPLDYLKEVRTMINPNGQILVVVHNTKSLLNKIMKSFWPPYCLQHPLLYNRVSITRLFKESGFAVVKFDRASNFLSLNTLVTNLVEVLSGRKIRRNFLPNIQIRLNFGNLIVVAVPNFETFTDK